MSLLQEGGSSVNSYGYSPHSLSDYLDWVGEILNESKSEKPIIISVGTDGLNEMLKRIGSLGKEVGTGRLGMEVNMSCPNLGGKIPVGYDIEGMVEVLRKVKDYRAKDNDSEMTIGLKLPPYIWDGQMSDVVMAIKREAGNSINFLTSTNTLGNTIEYSGENIGPVRGGMGGGWIHGLALGNVSGLRRHLDQNQLGFIEIIGVGGVSDHHSYIRMRKAGASAVALATALGSVGTEIFVHIL